jgi:UDP-N-acetylglucosamine 4-epimerase
MTSNEVNITGFLNMLIASRDNNVNRFIFAASSSVYGDSKVLPKVEDIIGKPLSPYAITKIVNELYAEVFANTYGISTIGLRYFNVFGRRQDPDGAYAAVIPKFIRALMIGQSPIVNGDGNYSRDFTYIDNVIQANIISMKTENPRALNNVYNIAFGERITINELLINIKMFLSEYNKEILQVPIVYGETREGDIPHSHANIEKAKKILGYAPAFDLSLGLKETVNWYWKQM